MSGIAALSPSPILIVEDEEILQLVIMDALAEAGFQCVVASSGAEAMSLLNEEHATFSALLTDIRLGAGILGWAVARHARKLNHALPVVYISGDSGADWTVEGVPNSVFISKPFSVAQIITAISAGLTNRR